MQLITGFRRVTRGLAALCFFGITASPVHATEVTMQNAISATW